MRELYHDVANNRSNLYGIYLMKKRREMGVSRALLALRMQQRGLTAARRESIYHIEIGDRTANDIEIAIINSILGFDPIDVNEFICAEISRNCERIMDKEAEQSDEK